MQENKQIYTRMLCLVCIAEGIDWSSHNNKRKNEGHVFHLTQILEDHAVGETTLFPNISIVRAAET